MHSFVILRFVLGALVVAGCSPALPRAPVLPTDDPAFASAALPPKPGLDEPTTDGDDVLCTGDVAAVKTFGSFDMGPTGTPTMAAGPSIDETAVLVERSGKVHLPLLGDIEVAGLSIGDAEARVQKRLSTIDRFGRVSLTIADPRGHFATVTGAVERSGNIPLIGDARFLDVLSAAGGPKLYQVDGKFVSTGDIDNARIIRKGITLPIDAHLALEGNIHHNVRIRPGDVIVVPPALEGRIAVIGHVGLQKTLSYHRNYRLTEAIADSGGITIDADLEDIRILRGGLAHPKVFVANARDVLAGRRADVVLAPGDVIFITEHWTGTLGRILDRGVPLLAGVFYAQSLTK